MSADKNKLPRHIAIIMDGNNRWSKEQSSPRLSGHRKGAIQAQSITNYCIDLKIDYLTLFVFSSENWLRPKKEVISLMALFLSVLHHHEINKLNKRDVKINFIGDRERFSKNLRDHMKIAEGLTKDNVGLNINIAANYGGRWDIANATKKIAKKVKQGQLKTEEINESLFQSYISLGNIPEPDLCIRTGGERRISNFLLWHFAYTEFYFTETFWPEFSKKDLDMALKSYAGRQRRYGKTSKQVER